jgi:hypothetical protein
MSEIITDTITGKSTATTITIGSTPVVSASANSMTIRGEGSAQTSIQGGLAKLWLRYESSAIQDSLNVSSISDLGVVATNLLVGYTNNFADKSTYAPLGQFGTNIDGPSSNPGALRISVGTETNDCTTSQLGGSIANAEANAMMDWVAGRLMILGDLA